MIAVAAAGRSDVSSTASPITKTFMKQIKSKFTGNHPPTSRTCHIHSSHHRNVTEFSSFLTPFSPPKILQLACTHVWFAFLNIIELNLSHYNMFNIASLRCTIVRGSFQFTHALVQLLH